MPYPQWLQQRQAHLSPISLFNSIPLAARFIHTPLIPAAWRHNLKKYPYQDLVEYFSLDLAQMEGPHNLQKRISKVQQIIQL